MSFPAGSSRSTCGLGPLFRGHLGSARLASFQPTLAPERDRGWILSLVRVERGSFTRGLVHDLPGESVRIARTLT
jgi:hypothetical protein